MRTLRSNEVAQRVTIAIIIAFAVLSRFLLLRHHQINHDESIYALDSLKYLREGYRFDPDQHGPFMFSLNMAIFALLGASDSTILLGPATLGVALVVLPLLLVRVRGIDGRGAIMVSALLAVSPSFMYFSRMLKNDIYVATFLLGLVVFVIRYAAERRNRDLYAGAVCLGLLFATRVDAVFYSGLFLSFLLILWVMPRAENSIQPPATRRLLSGRAAALSAAIFLLIYLFFYSLLPRHLMGFSENTVALVRFWWNRHQLNLLPGPASYYLDLMLEYELPILVVFFLGLRRHLETDRVSALLFWSAFLVFGLLFAYGSTPLPFLGAHLHAGTVREVAFLAYWAFLGSWGTFTLLRRRKTLYAFLLVWAAAGNMFYGYAGEKQPQIVLFTLLPLTMSAGFFLSEQLREGNAWRMKWVYAPIAGAALCAYLYVAVVLCFVTYYYPSERLSNATTSPEVAQLRELLVRKSRETGLGKALPVKFMFTFSSDVLAWYLRDFPNKLYSLQLDRFYPVIIFHNHRRYEFRPLLDAYYDHFTIHTNLASGYVRHLQWWPAGALVDSLYRETHFQLFRWGHQPLPGAYIDVYIQKPHVTILPEDERRLARLNDVFARRTVPVLGQFGSRGSLRGELNGAADLDVDTEGNLYIADTLNRRVTKYGRDGTPLFSIEDDAHPLTPEGLGVCPETGSLFIAIPGGNEVREYSLEGKYLHSIVHPFVRPIDVACDGAGNILVVDQSPGKVLKFDRSGRLAADWAVRSDLFRSAAGIKTDKKDGTVLVADIGRRTLVRLDRKGRHLSSYDLPGIAEVQWQLFFDIDTLGNIFIPDLSNSRIVVLDPRGTPRMVIGEESRGFEGVLGPLSVAVRGSRLYVYSRHLERITEFNLEGLAISDAAWAKDRFHGLPATKAK